MNLRKIVMISLLGSMVVFSSACGNQGDTSKNSKESTTVTTTVKAANFDATPIADQYAVFNTSMGTFKVRLYGSKAPITVKNFDELVKKGFYNDVTFHRVIDGFMIQGGDPKGDGTGGPGYEIPDEIAKDLHFDKPGILAMANRGPNTGGSQFFITLAPTQWLDSKHTIFGAVVQGMDVVEKIGKVQTSKNDKPQVAVMIHSITLEEIPK